MVVIKGDLTPRSNMVEMRVSLSKRINNASSIDKVVMMNSRWLIIKRESIPEVVLQGVLLLTRRDLTNQQLQLKPKNHLKLSR